MDSFVFLVGDNSIHGVFLRNQLYLGQTVVMSFRGQFEKVGRGILREAKRREGEWAVLVEANGDEKRNTLLLKNIINKLNIY